MEKYFRELMVEADKILENDTVHEAVFEMTGSRTVIAFDPLFWYT